MSTQLNALMVNAGPDFVYDESYHIYMESHMKFLREHESTILITLDAVEVYKYLYDFQGFLNAMAVPMEDHWVVLRLNGFTGYHSFNELVEELLIPSPQLLDTLKRMYRTVSGRV